MWAIHQGGQANTEKLAVHFVSLNFFFFLFSFVSTKAFMPLALFLPRSPIPGCERPPKSSRCFFFWVPPGERNAFDACLIDVLTEVLPPAAGTPGSREPERESIGSRTCCSIWLRCSRELDFTSEETFPWLSKAQLLQIAYDIKLNCNLPLDGGIMGESTNWCL